ncbi:hypothetical protein AcW1_004171 [Taiwanofungus camphoratus]|nr:hypothetical protein AcW2_006815 [Antrodia cinnamomea]KAI0939025.1 hypothetical protein AcV5_000553 [Antrodia cinnamomea]KAI0951942.1 hypothetical protein AcV7_007894 [Antrodia cinnamomea]KAI0959313.1 hypothetical protein AcW1_004171 [Antrodia cinnamomea]
MLALAHPMQHTSTVTAVDHPHRPQSSTSSSSSRSTRPPQRKFQSSFVTPTHHNHTPSSSFINLTASSANQSAPFEARSAHRAVSQRTPPSQPSQPPVLRHLQEDEDPHTPPVSDSEDNEPVQPDSTATDVHTYEPEALLRMLATALKRIAELNATAPADAYAPSGSQSHPLDSSRSDSHPPIWRTLTSASRHSLATTSSLAFHARNVPTIALEGYLNRIHKYCPASNEVFVSLLVYLDRMTSLAKEACGKTFPIDMYNIHRLIIAGVTVASKFFSDVFYTNSRYAKVGGLPLAELNQLELQFLLLNDFQLTISCEEMQFFTNMVDLQSKIPDSVNLSDYLPLSSSPKALGTHPPVGPREFFTAVERYFVHQHALAHPELALHDYVDPDDASLLCPSSQYGHTRRSYSTTSGSDVASEAGTETDVEGSTDDEPTIRPPHSSASSETMSLHSTASDADSIFTNDGEMSRDEHSADNICASAGTPGREYMIMRTPTS